MTIPPAGKSSDDQMFIQMVVATIAWLVALAICAVVLLGVGLAAFGGVPGGAFLWVNLAFLATLLYVVAIFAAFVSARGFSAWMKEVVQRGAVLLGVGSIAVFVPAFPILLFNYTRHSSRFEIPGAGCASAFLIAAFCSVPLATIPLWVMTVWTSRQKPRREIRVLLIARSTLVWSFLILAYPVLVPLLVFWVNRWLGESY